VVREWLETALGFSFGTVAFDSGVIRVRKPSDVYGISIWNASIRIQSTVFHLGVYLGNPGIF